MAHSHLYHVDPPKELSFEANRIYVACEMDENLPMILQSISEDNLLIGSDYSHHDVSSEVGFVAGLGELGNREVITQTQARKTICDNPNAFHGL